MAPALILHHYPRSPYAEKIRLALGLKGLAYHAVTIPPLLPRPELMSLTGGYRRTPVLQIGADIFCDTLAILRAIDRLHPAPPLFPSDTEAALGQWIERAIFIPAIGVVRSLADAPPNPAMTADRRAFFGFDIDKPAMLAQQPVFLQRLATHIAWLTSLLADNRPYLLGQSLTAFDLAAYHPLWFIQQNAPEAASLLPALSILRPWYDRLTSVGHGHPTPLSAAEALAIATTASPAPLTAPRSDLPGFQVGASVTVTPDDTGRTPVQGTLAAVTKDTITLSRSDPTLGPLHLHFPRSGFDMTPAQ